MAVPCRMNRWLQRSGHRVVGTRTDFASGAPEVAAAIERGVAVFPDTRRADFYEIDTGSGCYYIHIYEAGRTVYVLSALARQHRAGRAATAPEYAVSV